MYPLLKKMLAGDRRALARLMTFVDNRHDKLLSLMKEVYREIKGGIRVGFTGPPGAGKSTLISEIIARYRKIGKTVGVVAIDPSSPFSGGAVLGDRIRMMNHGGDAGVFIRSLGSRGAHGGLSQATRDIVHLLDAAGFEAILIETVGVGQSELDIKSVADITIVVLVPESGDTIQTMKAGLMEIADIFVVNKGDREGADRMANELKALAGMNPTGPKIPVLKVSAIKKEGIDDLMSEIQKLTSDKKIASSKNGSILKMIQEEGIDIVLSEVRRELQLLLNNAKTGKKLSQVFSKNKNPYEGAEFLLNQIKWKEMT